MKLQLQKVLLATVAGVSLLSGCAPLEKPSDWADSSVTSCDAQAASKAAGSQTGPAPSSSTTSKRTGGRRCQRNR